MSHPKNPSQPDEPWVATTSVAVLMTEESELLGDTAMLERLPEMVPATCAAFDKSDAMTGDSATQRSTALCRAAREGAGQ